MSSLSTLKRYVKYLLKGKTRYLIHSPYLFAFVNEVLRDTRQYYAFEEIEQLLAKLKKDNTTITVNDLGAGSKQLQGKERSINKIARNTSIPAKYGTLLFRLVNHYNATQILELGTGLGISTLYLAMANPKAQVITLEGSPDIAKKAQAHFNHFGLDNIELTTGSFANTLEPSLKKLSKVDLLYLDGDHRKDAVLNNFNLILPKLHSGSVVVLDDINWSDEMSEAWKQISHYPQVTLSVDLFRCGILFFRKEMATKHVRLYY